MNCLEVRRLILIDPEEKSPGLRMHLESCSGCASFVAEMRQQNELIKKAAHIDVPEGFAARILLNQSLQHQSRRPTRAVWLSLAASIVIAAALLPAVLDEWFYEPFEQDVIAHISSHDVLAHRDNAPADREKVFTILAAANTAMPVDTSNVLYASTCVIDGVTMAHLLVRNGDDDYVLLLMPEDLPAARSFTAPSWYAQAETVGNRGLLLINRDGTNLVQATHNFRNQFSRSI